MNCCKTALIKYWRRRNTLTPPASVLHERNVTKRTHRVETTACFQRIHTPLHLHFQFLGSSKIITFRQRQNVNPLISYRDLWRTTSEHFHPKLQQLPYLPAQNIGKNIKIQTLGARLFQLFAPLRKRASAPSKAENVSNSNLPTLRSFFSNTTLAPSLDNPVICAGTATMVSYVWISRKAWWECQLF